MSEYSQLNQDEDVLAYFENKQNGFFLEMGGLDGIRHSNTYYLEKDFGWDGICVEPSYYFSDLVKNRKCKCVEAAVYNESGVEVEFVEYEGLSGIKDEIDHHKKVLESPSKMVTTVTLQELLDSCESPNYIDYFSLDTEGSELKILQSVDFSKYSFGFISVEHNQSEPRRSQIKELLTSNGYQYYKQKSWDDYYILKTNGT